MRGARKLTWRGLEVAEESARKRQARESEKKDEQSPVTYRGRKQISFCGIVLLCGESETKTYNVHRSQL